MIITFAYQAFPPSTQLTANVQLSAQRQSSYLSLWLPTLITVCAITTQIIKFSSSEFMDASPRSAALVESPADTTEL